MITKLPKNLSIGEFLRVYRQGEAMSQVELSKKLGISKQRLCDIEKNRFPISIKLAIKIAKKLDLSPEWLVKLILQNQIEQEKLKLKVV